MTPSARLAGHAGTATRLALLSDRRLAAALASARPLAPGVGGRPAVLDLDGTRVFVKRVPLTARELRPEHVRSTANVFGLPLHYQYGLGSAGFGAWRELAAHTLTTHWVLSGACPDFPLLYHWRVLPDGPPEGFADEFGGVAGAVAHWEGEPAVRERLEEIGRSAHSLVLFLEHLPHTLAAWLAAHPGDAPRTAGALARGTAFLRARGMVHFDAHFRNVMTDGERIYFGDLGLALSSAFELTPAEAAFLARHRHYDGVYVAAHLARHHGGHLAAELREAAAVLDAFHGRLMTESKRTPYPAEEIERALAAARIAPPDSWHP